MQNQHMSDEKKPGAPPGNKNAAKPPDEKLTGKGRITADFGDLKAVCVKAAQEEGMKLVPWLREAAQEKIPYSAGAGGMKLKRDVSQEQFEELCLVTGRTYSSLKKQWQVGMKTLLIQSSEYRSICRAGRSCRDLTMKLLDEARDRGYPEEQIKELFGDACDLGCSFN